MPHAASVQTVPPAAATAQVTPLFATSFVTVAVNSCGPATKRLARVGVIETEMFWAWTVKAQTDEIQASNRAFSLHIFLLLSDFVGASDFKALRIFSTCCRVRLNSMSTMGKLTRASLAS